MLGFGKKKERQPAYPPASGMGVPTQKVLSLSQQGFSEPEIVSKLRQEGYAPLEVDRAMKDAMRTGAGGQAMPQAPAGPEAAPGPPTPAAPAPPESGQPQPSAPMGPPLMQQPGPGQTPMGPEPGFRPRDRFAPTKYDDDDDMMDDDLDMDKFEGMPKERRMGPDAFVSDAERSLSSPSQPEMDEPEPLPFAKAPLPKEKDDRMRELKDRRRREIEELAEEITEEKWQDLMSRVHVVEESIEKLGSEIRNTEAQSTGIGSEDLGKVKDELANQKEGIEELNARIDSIEDVVKNSLSPMIESVRKLNKTIPEKKTEEPAPPAEPEPKEKPKDDDEPGEPPRYSPQARS